MSCEKDPLSDHSLTTAGQGQISKTVPCGISLVGETSSVKAELSIKNQRLGWVG
jgi:hypothetical protein